MTYTKPEIDSNAKINPREDIEVIARRIEAAAQQQVAADIDRLKAMGKPIHYSQGEKIALSRSISAATCFCAAASILRAIVSISSWGLIFALESISGFV